MTWIKKAYLYLVSLISLVIIVVAGIMLLNLVLKTYIFKAADRPYRYPYNCSESVVEPMAKVQECDEEFVKKQEEAEKQNHKAQKQREAAQAIAMILVATPVFIGHWRLARREV